MSEPTAPPVQARPMQETGPIPPYFGPMGRSAQSPAQEPAQAPAPRAADGDADTAEAPAVPAGATAVGASDESPTLVEPAVPAPGGDPAESPVAAWALTGDGLTGPDDVPPPGTFPTTPVSSRPTVRARRRDPMTRMGPWAPAAGGLLGLVAGIVVAVVLAGQADVFSEGLALVFLVIGLSMLGAAGALLADEVRLVRRGAREAAVRPAWVEATAGLLNGLTPARLLLATSAFVLFLAAYVGR
ncbi:hypothetical protein [Blastococcus sp. URHD0036]|uniref:hypothetical protein n=1 Tax=Blastococcus sp. URHD0036 TaxID=1380356 RepID=UPI0018CBF6AF|nr:hypothetical protein [Blastococcus sp. URHD0036]